MRRLLLASFAVLSLCTAAAWGSTREALFSGSVNGGVARLALVSHRAEASSRKRSASGSLLFGTRKVDRVVLASDARVAEAFGFVDGATGRASAVTLYVGRGSSAGDVVVGLYSNRAGGPGSRLASGSLRSPRSGAWNTVGISRTLVKPGVYWVVVFGKGGVLHLRGTGGRRCRAGRVSKRALSLDAQGVDERPAIERLFDLRLCERDSVDRALYRRAAWATRGHDRDHYSSNASHASRRGVAGD